MGYRVRFPLLERRVSRRRAARLLLVAFSWYALAPLPWAVSTFAHAGHDGGLEASFVHVHEHEDAGHGLTASDIPGSPLHPEDHDCFDCQVIKYLARCILPDAAVPTVPTLDAAPADPPGFAPSPPAVFVVPTPPIRAPPVATG